MLTNSLERLVPDQLVSQEVTGQLTLSLHIERYEFAADQAQPGRLLDIACGVGYGTPILYDRNGQIREAIGVDCSEESVLHAREHYGKPGIQFRVGDAMTYEDSAGFDTIVTLETIEHVHDPEGLIAHLLQLLRPGGVFIGSVPSTPTVDANPHHLHDFTPRSIRNLVRPYGLSEISYMAQVQPFNPFTVLGRREKRLEDLRRNLGQYYLTNPSALFKRIASTLRFGFVNQYLTIAWRKPF